MTRGLTLIAAALVALAPLGVHAQTTDKTTDAKGGTAAGAAPAPAAPATKPEAKPAAVTFTPYGFVQFTADMNDANWASDAQYPGQVAFKQSATNTRSFLMHARNSRFGVRIGMPEAAGAKLGAVLEVDFRGGFCSATGCPDSSISFYQPLMRLRLAYGTATWKLGDVYNVTLEAGQDYGLVTPLFATSAAYTGDPIFWKAGNTWHRTPQIRLSGESTGPFGILWQVAALSPLDSGNPAGTETAFVGPGNRSRRPDLEGRLAVNMKSGTRKVIEAGVGGHLGWERYSTSAAVDPTKDLRSEMVGVDLALDFGFLGFKGEAWRGSNIEDYFTVGGGAVGQGTPNVRSARARGAWGQVVLQPTGTAVLQLLAGAGVEDRNPQDIVLTTTSPDQIRQNKMVSGGIIVNPSKNWRAGLEFTRTLTDYRTSTVTGTGAAATLGPASTVDRSGMQTALTTAFIF